MFDPTLPLNGAVISAAELRSQFTGLKTALEAADLAVIGQTAMNPSSVNTLSTMPSDPPTAAELQEVIAKINELIGALVRV